MPLFEEFLHILRCPESKAELIYFPEGEGSEGLPFLFCPASGLRYPINEHDIPVMLLEEATRVDERERERLLARAHELGLPVPAAYSNMLSKRVSSENASKRR